MKIKKIENLESHKLCLSEMSAVAQVILALDKARSSTAPVVEDPGEFQRRCSDAIIALADMVLGDVESHYAPEKRRFRVTYEVKRSGTHSMEVEADSPEAAERAAQASLDRNDMLDELHTEVLAADVRDVEEAGE